MSVSIAPFQKPPRGSQINLSHPLNRGLVACYLFNEGTGTHVHDLSLNENHGVLTNMTDGDWVSHWGGAINIDAADNHVAVGDHTTIQDLPAFSVVTWANCRGESENGTGPLFWKHTGSSSERNFWLNSPTGGSAAQVRTTVVTDATDAESDSSNNAWSTDTWHHLAMTFNDNGDRTIRVYVDGAEISYGKQVAATGTVDTDAGQLNIGSSDHFWTFLGQIADWRMWNRVLSADECRELCFGRYEEFGLRPLG